MSDPIPPEVGALVVAKCVAKCHEVAVEEAEANDNEVSEEPIACGAGCAMGQMACSLRGLGVGAGVARCREVCQPTFRWLGVDGPSAQSKACEQGCAYFGTIAVNVLG